MIHDGGRFQSGQMGRTVNPLSFDFRGSNPLLPTIHLNRYSTRHLCLRRETVRGFVLLYVKCGSSSVGRAIAFQAIGRGFEPRLPLYMSQAAAAAVVAQW